MTEDSGASPLRVPIIYAHSRLVGLIGWPIEHSVSPPMHNVAFDALGLDWCYVPLPVPPQRLREAVEGVRALGLRGVNATVPHKQALLPLLDELTPAAETIGAVNTIVVDEEKLVGHNTDARGFMQAVREAGFSPDGCTALVLGAGGAARAVVYALGGVAERVIVLNRTMQRAHDLVGYFQRRVSAELEAGPLEAAAISEMASEVDLVVNATPVGMWPQVDASPWPVGVPFPPGAFCFDLIYHPRETHLMHTARAAGAGAANGLGMLVHQGAEAFELWTGREPPVKVMYAACERVLERE
ncbi:MAG: shikimate dehydrogenase [Chloroflexota bacterium]|nr:shikimate dehydrogenase [Chloroflexota bacterium]